MPVEDVQDVSYGRRAGGELSAAPWHQGPRPSGRDHGGLRIERRSQWLPTPPVSPESAAVHHAPASSLPGNGGVPRDIDEEHLGIPTPQPGQSADQTEAYPPCRGVMHHDAGAAPRAGEQDEKHADLVGQVHHRAHEAIRHRLHMAGEPSPLSVGVQEAYAGQQRLQPLQGHRLAGTRDPADEHEGRPCCRYPGAEMCLSHSGLHAGRVIPQVFLTLCKPAWSCRLAGAERQRTLGLVKPETSAANRPSALRRGVRQLHTAVRASVRQGWRRTTGSAWPIMQAAIAASLAWLVAHNLLGHVNPMFAPIATWVCLGIKVDRQPRRVAELGAGATIGVLIGELFARYVSIGWWQILLVIPIAALIARFLDHGELFTIQAGVNAVVVLGMSWYVAQQGGAADRWTDALVGALVAFVFAVLLPRRVSVRPRRYAATTLLEFGRTLDLVAKGLRQHDSDAFDEAMVQRRAGWRVYGQFEEALTTARDVVRLNPTLRADQPVIEELERLHRLIARAHRSEAMLSRQSRSMLDEVAEIPELAEMVRKVGRATKFLAESVQRWERPTWAREILIEVAGDTNPAEIDTQDWRPLALMSLLRALVVDLLQLTGLSRADARALLPDTRGLRYADPPSGQPEVNDDASSAIWG